MLYKVAITETRRRVVAVDAQNPAEAHQRITDAWRNGEVVLRDEDFEGIEVYVYGTTRNIGNKQVIEGKDVY